MIAATQRPPPPWTFGGPSQDYALSIDRTGPGAVAKLHARVAEPRDFASITQSIRAARYRGQRVRFRATVRTVDVVGRAWLWLRVDGERGTPALAFDGMARRPLDGSSDWAEHAVVLDVVEAARTLHFGFAMHGIGAFEVRDLAFEVVDASVPLTAGETMLADQPANLELADVTG